MTAFFKSILAALSFLLLFCPAEILAEQNENEFRMRLENRPNLSVHISITMGDVTIIGHDREELVIEPADRNRQARSARAEGLRSLHSNEEDNTNLGLSVNWEQNGVRIQSASRRPGNFIIYVPDKVLLDYRESSPGMGSLQVLNHSGQIAVQTIASPVSLMDVTGPLMISAGASDVQILFSEVNQERPSHISTVSGFLDVTVPADTRANWQIRSEIGDIFTNLDLQTDRDETQGTSRRSGLHISAKTGEGGVGISLTSVAGNVYLRKRE